MKNFQKKSQIKLKVLFEDENILAIDKPTNLLVYAPANYRGRETTLHDLVIDKLDFPRKGERNGIVHRLDRETSGVIIVAKNKKTENVLKKLFFERAIKKHYLALVFGKIEPKEGRITIPLGRASKDRLKVVPKASGKPSETIYRVLKYYPKSNYSLLEIGLKTGRMHQIRAHLAAIGFPVVGDKVYSAKKTDIERQFLHAEKVEFKNPINGEKVILKSELPEELQDFLNTLD